MHGRGKITNECKISHKDKKLRSYPVKIKVEAVKYAQINGNRAAGRKCC